MTDLRAAAEQARTALNWAADHIPPQGDHCQCPVCVALEALEAALKQPEPPPLTFDKLANALVMSRLIDKDAIENPEGYDDGVTLEQVRAAYRRLV